MAAGTLHFEPLEPRLLLNADLIEPVPLSSLDTYLGGDAIYVDLSRPGEDAGPSFQPSTELVGQEQPIVAAGTSYVVNSLEDVVAWDGKLTLREAIQAANTNAPVGDAPAGHSDDTDVIRFASSLSGGTITLNGSQLSVNGDIQIIGLGDDLLTVSAGGRSRVFFIEGTGTDALLEGLTIAGGSAYYGGGMYVYGATATFTDCTVSGNSATGSACSSGGGLYVDAGTATLAGCTVTGNSTSGGGSLSGGAGLYVSSGTLTLTDSTIAGNSALYGCGGALVYNGTLSLTNCVVSQNSGSDGGGLWIGDATVVLTDCTINGNSASSMGGGVYVVSGVVTLTDCMVSGNSASRGGGFDVWGSYGSATVTLTNCTVSGNSASSSHGGGLHVVAATLTMENCAVTGNSAAGAGAGLYIGNTVTGTATVALTNCTISENSGSGGIWVTGPDITLTLTDSMISRNSGYGGLCMDSTNATATLANCTINENTGSYGGGLKISGTAVLTDCMISENSASSMGGGVYVVSGAVTLTDCMVSGNSASYGGGFYVYGPYGSATVTLTNCTVSGNSASGSHPFSGGGGLYVESGTVTLTNCMVNGNSASTSGSYPGGGGLYVISGTLTLTNSTVSGNWASSCGGGLSVYGGAPTLNNTIVAINAAPTGADIQGVYGGSANFIGGDPGFVRNPSAGVDGIWGTPDDDPGDLRLRAASPCVDAGSNALAVDPGGQPLAIDLDGNPRVFGDTVDIGAYEYRAPELVTSVDSVVVPEGSTAGFDVRLTARPESDVTVTITRISGDSDVSVSSGSTLTFTTANWNTYRTVTLNAAEDVDGIDGTATIQCSASGLLSKDVIATEQDNEVPRPVYRFWSPVHSRHFYTISVAERDKLINNYAHVWTYEGPAYSAFADGSQPGVAPIYRFWSGTLNAHFYTMSQSERDKLINNYPHVWTYEGVAFYAYAAGSQPVGTSAVYRFWSGTLNCHFFTMDPDERDKLINLYSHVWTYEQIAWYAFSS